MRPLTLSIGFLVAAFVVTLTSPPAAEAAECKVKLEDVGIIVGKGSTKNLAFEDAATQCFERRERKMKSRRSASISSAGLDEEAGLTLIDLCANVRCS